MMKESKYIIGPINMDSQYLFTFNKPCTPTYTNIKSINCLLKNKEFRSNTRQNHKLIDIADIGTYISDKCYSLYMLYYNIIY